VSHNLFHGTTLNFVANLGLVSLTELDLTTPLLIHIQRTVKTDCGMYNLVYHVMKFDKFALNVKTAD
jgi:hypothetical protein